MRQSGRNRDLLVAYHQRGERDARDRLIEENLPLVRALAGRYAGCGEQVDDLIQVGSIGLIKAVDRFRVERSVDLAAYAAPMIVGEIRRHLRDRAWPMRRPRGQPASDRCDVQSLEGAEYLVSSASAAELERGEQRALLNPGLSSLDRRERLVVGLRFYGDLSQHRIASEVGLSQGHVSRLLRTSIAHMRSEIGAS